MSDAAPGTRTVTVERDFPFPPDQIWRALTQPDLIEAWLMKSDFKLIVGHEFRFTAAWGSVDCQVKIVEPNKTLSYTWSAMGLDSIVTWTLTPTATGTHVRMEQSGFRTEQEQEYRGAFAGWQRFFANLEAVVARSGA